MTLVKSEGHTLLYSACPCHWETRPFFASAGQYHEEWLHPKVKCSTCLNVMDKWVVEYTITVIYG